MFCLIFVIYNKDLEELGVLIKNSHCDDEEFNYPEWAANESLDVVKLVLFYSATISLAIL